MPSPFSFRRHVKNTSSFFPPLLADSQFFFFISTLLNLNFWQFSRAALQSYSIRAVTSSQSSQDKQF